MSRFVVAAALVASLVACSSPPSSNADHTDQGDTTATDAGAPNAAGAPMTNDVKWFRDSAEYQSITRQTYRLAAARADMAAASHTKGAASWAVVLDADETILDNSEYQKERMGVGFSPDTWAAWVKRKEARAIPGSVAFTQHVRSVGGLVIVVTNRTADQCDDTQDNMKALGFAFDEVLCAPDATVTDKNPRFKAVTDGVAPSTMPALDVVLYIGDAIGDLPGLDQTIRDKSDDAFAAFGDTFLQLPNPMYGSWAKNPSE
jgi:5'-nucleotidase (lipoprotein e(P4) family)